MMARELLDSAWIPMMAKIEAGDDVSAPIDRVTWSQNEWDHDGPRGMGL
jgi:hypothetical protein